MESNQIKNMKAISSGNDSCEYFQPEKQICVFQPSWHQKVDSFLHLFNQMCDLSGFSNDTKRRLLYMYVQKAKTIKIEQEELSKELESLQRSPLVSQDEKIWCWIQIDLPEEYKSFKPASLLVLDYYVTHCNFPSEDFDRIGALLLEFFKMLSGEEWDEKDPIQAILYRITLFLQTKFIESRI